jgi:hypothetical protein
MENMQAFSANDVQNGTLSRMFRAAGIDDVSSYIDDIRQDADTHEDQHNMNFLQHQSSPSVRSSTNVKHRRGGKHLMDNAKQVYQLVNQKIT